MTQDQLFEKISQFEPSVVRRENGTPLTVEVEVGKLAQLMEHLRFRPDLEFSLLLDHTAIDWPEADQFELVYQLYSMSMGEFIAIHTKVSRQAPVVPTMCKKWAIAEWQEREVYDLFGIVYQDHPDLRRLFLEDDWQGFPLRKDYEDDFMLELPK